MAESGLQPGVLLAMPASSDLTLSRAVLLLIRHGDQGSFGFILNSPSTFKTSALFDSLGMSWRGDIVVFRGGPVSIDKAWVLHESIAGTVAITPEIAMSNTIEQLRAIEAAPPSRFKMVLGSIDWAPDQLARTMPRGVARAHADPELVFDTAPELLWDRVQAIGVEPVEAHGVGARIRRMFGLAPAIPRATMRRK
jgi:putative transcriptional regulator